MPTSAQDSASIITLPCKALNLLPHRPPMLLLDSLISRSKNGATATALLTTESICFSQERGIIPEYLIELIAQTIAAVNGYDRAQNNGTILDGFIIAIDSFELIHQPILCNSSLYFHIEVEEIDHLDSLFIYAGNVFQEEQLLAKAELKVLQRERVSN